MFLCGIEATLEQARLFVEGGITEAEKRQLFDEHVQWYSMYGMSMRPVPKTWEDYAQVAQFITDQMAPEVYGAGHFRKAGSPDIGFIRLSISCTPVRLLSEANNWP